MALTQQHVFVDTDVLTADQLNTEFGNLYTGINNLMQTGTAASRPAGVAGMLYFATDTKAPSQFDGAAWQTLAYTTAAQTWTAQQTFAASGIKLTGAAGATTFASNATAARTITFPDVSGNVVTTGDTGTVTNAMLQNKSVTVTAGSGLAGGGSAALGGSVTLTLDTAHPNTWTATQTFTSPRVAASLLDTNGNTLLGITATASAVNALTLANAATGDAPTLSATGADANIGVALAGKGTGTLSWNTNKLIADSNGNLTLAGTVTANGTGNHRFEGDVQVRSGKNLYVNNASNTASHALRDDGSNRLSINSWSGTRLQVGNIDVLTLGTGNATVSGSLQAQAVAATGLSGATAASRYVGGTTSGAPTSGTFAVGDFVIDQTGKMWICVAAGSPGTWVLATGTGMTNPMTAAGDLIVGGSSGAPTRLGIGSNGQVLSVVSGAVAWAAAPSSGGTTKIAQIMLSTSASSITFSNIPSTYQHLLLVLSSRGDMSDSTKEQIMVQFNDDTTNHYCWTIVSGDSGAAPSSISSASGTAIVVGYQGGIGSTLTCFASTQLLIPNYADVLPYKSLVGTNFAAYATAGAIASTVGGGWMNSSAITKIKIFPGTSANFVTWTVATLYGLTS